MASDAADQVLSAPAPAPKWPGFAAPTAEEREAGAGLVGRIVQIWWEGDEVYYAGRVEAFDAARGVHRVRYEDGAEDPYEEALRSSEGWRLWGGDEAEYARRRAEEVPLRMRA